MVRFKNRVYLPGAPTAADEAVIKSFVDARVPPTGGTAGYVLTKNSGTDYDFSWAAPTGGGGGTVAGPHTIRTQDDYDDSTMPADQQAILWVNSLSKFKPITLTASLVGADAAGAATSGDSAHVAASDPHTTYLNNARGDARYAALSHTHSASDIVSGTLAYARLPVGTAASTVAAGDDSRFTNARTPTAHAASHAPGGSDALTGYVDTSTNQTVGGQKTIASGAANQWIFNQPPQIAVGSLANHPVRRDDSRMTDARTPLAHAASHATGQSDAIAPSAIGAEASANKGTASGYASLDSGTKVPIAQLPTGTSATTVTIGNDSRLSDARTPTAHAASHASGGSDVITPASIGAASSGDSRFTDARTPTGTAGGSLAGTYPNPTIAAGAIGGTEIATAIKDPVAATAGLRTLGTGAQQAAAGNDARFTDSRAPSGAAGGDLTGTYPNPTLRATLSDPAAGTAGLRTLGTGALQATAGNDSRLSDARTPTGAAGGDLTGTYPNPTLRATLSDPAAATAGLRTLGTGAQQAAAGNDARLSDARTPTAHVHAGTDITTGTVAYARLPVGTAASTVAAGDDARFTNARTPTAHAATHAAGGSDVITPQSIGAAVGTAPTSIKTANYTAAFGELVLVDASAGPVTITLPTITANGQRIAVKRVDNTPANLVTVATSGGNTIGSSGAASVPLRLQDQAGTYQASGTNWVIPHGYLGLPSLDARFASITDARLSDARTPLAHKASHNVGGTDDLSTYFVPWVNVAAANGVASLDASTKIPIGQVPTGQTGTTVPLGNDARFSDARTPLAHVHAGADISSGTVAYARLPVGTTASTIAAGDDTRLANSRPWSLYTPGSEANGQVPTWNGAAYVPGTPSGGNIFPPGPSPASILNIGPRAGQNHFALQAARTGDAAYFTKSLYDLAQGYEESPIFYSSTDRLWCVLRCDLAAPTTSGSAYSRTELRELDESGANMAFDATLAGTHRMSGVHIIDHVNATLPAVIMCQLHNGDTGDRVSFRSQLISGVMKIVLRVNGTEVKNASNQRPAESYTQGTQVLAWKIEVINNQVFFYFQDMVTPWYTSATNIFTQTAVNGGVSWYFKAGCYNQATPADASPLTNEYGQVRLQNLSHWHTGWATPATYWATPKHAATHAAGSYDAISPASIGAVAAGYTAQIPAISAGGSAVITHNLGTNAILPMIARTTAPFDFVNIRMERTSVNTLTLLPDVAMAANAFEIIIGRIN